MEEQNHCSQDHESGVTVSLMCTRKELSHFKYLEMYQTCVLEHLLALQTWAHLTRLLLGKSGCFHKSSALP